MFIYRNKLSALALGTLLSIFALQPAMAAEEAKMARNSQQISDAPCADSEKQLNDNADKTDSSPDTWLERQLRIPGG